MNELFENIAKTNQTVAEFTQIWEAAENFAGINQKMDYYLRFHIIASLSRSFKRSKRVAQQ